MRITTLVCACALALFGSQAILAFDAAAQVSPPAEGMGGLPGSEVSSGAAERDPAERSAKSIECAQKADAQALQGKIRRRFLRQCKSGG
jgi:hypothetical protein